MKMWIWLASALVATGMTASAATLELVSYMNVIPAVGNTPASGQSRPRGKGTKVGDFLYFMTYRGGPSDKGTISRTNLNTGVTEVVRNLGLGNPAIDPGTGEIIFPDETGVDPWSGDLIRQGDWLYYNTQNGGTYNGGTLSRFNHVTGVNEILFNFGSDAANGEAPSATNSRGIGNSPQGSPAVVSDGAGGLHVYSVTYSGGQNYSASNAEDVVGVLVRWSSATGTTEVLHHFGSPTVGMTTPNPNQGTRPWRGVIENNGKLYFTTANGGNDFSPASAGAGVVGSWDIATGQYRVVSYLTGETGRQPFGDVVISADGNSMYVTTVGAAVATQGNLVKIDLEAWKTNPDSAVGYSVLHSFNGGANGAQANQGGLIYGDYYYQVTTGGGTGNSGVVGAYNLLTGEWQTIFDLGVVSDTNGTVNWLMADRPNDAPFIVNVGGQDWIYFLSELGGQGNQGSLVRFAPIPEPGAACLALVPIAILLRRRRPDWKDSP